MEVTPYLADGGVGVWGDQAIKVSAVYLPAFVQQLCLQSCYN